MVYGATKAPPVRREKTLEECSKQPHCLFLLAWEVRERVLASAMLANLARLSKPMIINPPFPHYFLSTLFNVHVHFAAEACGISIRYTFNVDFQGCSCRLSLS